MIKVTVAIGLLVLSAFFLKLCLASIIATRPEMAIANLERHAKIDDAEQIEQHLGRLNTAIAMYPSNANYYTLAGRYQALLAKFSQIKANEYQTSYYFEQAVKLEPSAYVHRARHVEYLYRQHGWSSELDEVFSIAIEVGKYEKLPQSILLPIAFKNWRELSKESQQSIHLTLDSMFSMHSHFVKALRIAAKYCALDLLVKHAINVKQTNAIKRKIEKHKECL